MLRNYGLPLLLLMIALLLTACAAKSDAAMEQNPAATGITIDAKMLFFAHIHTPAMTKPAS